MYVKVREFEDVTDLQHLLEKILVKSTCADFFSLIYIYVCVCSDI